jgi:hypothetical protein
MPLLVPTQTPASEETGVRIGLVAGVRYEAQERKRGREVVRVRFVMPGSIWAPAGFCSPEAMGQQLLP